MKLDTYHLAYMKTSLKWITYLNFEPEVLNLTARGKYREYFSRHWSRQEFSGQNFNSIGTSLSINWCDHIKVVVHRTKTKPKHQPKKESTEEERKKKNNIYMYISCTQNKGLIFRIGKEKHKLNTKKIKLPVKKWTN